MRPETSLEAEVQHVSKAHPGDKDRTGNKQHHPEALLVLPVPAHPQGSPHTPPAHGHDPISDTQSHQPLPQQGWSLDPHSPACPAMHPPSPAHPWAHVLAQPQPIQEGWWDRCWLGRTCPARPPGESPLLLAAGPQEAPGPPCALTVASPRDNLSANKSLRCIQEAGPELWAGCWTG